MSGGKFSLLAVADVSAATLRLATETFSAVALDAACVPSADAEARLLLKRHKGGLALFVFEPTTLLSPAHKLPLRRLTWQLLPMGFLDQVRAVDAPIVFMVEQSLYITQALQNALRQSGVMFIQMESPRGLIELLADQNRLATEQRTLASPSPGGFWKRLTGKEQENEPQALLGKVVVVKFGQSEADAVALDVRLRQMIPSAVAYTVTPVDPISAATTAIKDGLPAVLPRETAPRVAEMVVGALEEALLGSRKSERILIVDNETAALARLSEALLACGHEIVATTDGAEGLRLMTAKPFALAAIGGSALEATKLSGTKLALALREKSPNLRIVLMIDQFPAQDALRGLSLAIERGFDDAILKPIDIGRLLMTINRALNDRFTKLENERLNEEVRISKEKLAEVNGFQTKFFATVAHDVKNPLTAILGYAEVLGMRLKNKPEDLACAVHILNAAKSVNRLISDLVDLAAIESGKLRVEIGALDLIAVITEVKSRVDVVAAHKQIQFSAMLPPLVPALRGDPSRIGQVIQNLCTNAVQYTTEGGKVSIEVSMRPDCVIVGVRDTGIGISKEDLPRVWTRFFQTQEAQTMRKAGFGLGLKISREIVQMHGGEMGIESELGVGSFFFFNLPISKTPSPASA